MGRKVTAKIRAGILIPLKQLDEFEVEELQNRATWHQYLDPYACKECEHEDEKPNDCGSCELYKCHKFYERKSIKGEPVIVIRKGLRRMIERVLRKRIEFEDYQSHVPMSTDKYKFDYTMLNPAQQGAHDDIVAKLQAGYCCILKSAARTGKTVMATSIIFSMKVRTLFIAHQEDLLMGKGQLISTFLEKTKETAPINPNRYFTNLHKFVEKGKTPVKYARTLEDFLETDICLTTYQIFLHPRGRAILEEIKDSYGLIVTDEGHKTASEKYSEILNQFTCPRLTITATPKRKDGRERIMHSIFGNVEHETKADSLKPKVSIVRTGYSSSKNFKIWTYFIQHLNGLKTRNEKIAAFAYRDVKSNGRSILIPMMYHKDIDNMVELLRSMGIRAKGWDGRLKKNVRHIPLDDAATGKIDVLVAQRSMLTGINIPRWDTLYWVTPMSNDPNFEQEYKRICTDMPGKQLPVVRFFVDDWEIVERCFFNCASVIKRQGGTFTKAALEDYTATGKRLGKIKESTTRAERKEKGDVKKRGDRVKKASMSLFGEDVELEEDNSPTEQPVKKPKKLKTKRELFNGVL